VPYFGIDRDAETHVFFTELQGLFARVADGVAGIGWRCLLERVEDGVGDLGELLRIGDGGGVDGEEDLGEAGLAEGVAGNLMGGQTAGEHRGEHIEDEGESRALPIADGQGALGCFDGRGVAGEIARSVEAAVDGERLSVLAVGGEGAVGELRHRHV
jgi:hypothetical protein